jgi:hypothetical protein
MTPIAPDNATTDRVTVWQCIGCGRIEMPQPCIDLCQDRKVEFVYANVYDETLSQAELMRLKAEALETLVRRLAHTIPRNGAWERSYRTFQSEAKRILLTFAVDREERAQK